ncbi:ChrR family anti-sigma-E factor [Aestuariirhabdus sp. LZHN29]|uniref:ChrR family anti-sigma-E factor n=1 Tax=Aestuariirhabdus sp. LZHN29 TaxID=3417462 RepID=UPI003CFAB120
MIKQHPTSDLLAEYAAGSLPWAQAVCVTTHLHYCSTCTMEVDTLNQLGAQLMAGDSEAAADTALLDRVLKEIDQPREQAPAQVATVPLSAGARADLPPIVNHLIGTTEVQWKRVSSGLRAAHLNVGDTEHEVALHKICAGAKVAHHDHRATEVTVVLRGSFSDEDGVYGEGDFLLREPGETHRPMAAQNQDCLCLSAQQAPIRLTGAWCWLNPFLRIQPG